MVVAPQVAFVAGALALVRALRRRGRAMPTAELSVLRRRTLVALASGVVTMGALVRLRPRVRAVARRVVDDGDVLSPRRPRRCCSSQPPSRPPAPRGFKPELAGSAGDVFDDLGLARRRPVAPRLLGRGRRRRGGLARGHRPGRSARRPRPRNPRSGRLSRRLRGAREVPRPPSLASARVGRLARALSRRPESRPARGRPHDRRPAARHRRRRLRQDARPHAPRRASARDPRREAERDPRDHVHEQGRGRDARAARADARRRSRARSGS